MSKERTEKKKTNLGPIIVVGVILIAGIAAITIIAKNQINKKGNVSNTNGSGEQQVNAVVEEFVATTEDDTKMNTSSNLKEEKDYKGLKISNIQLTTKNNDTVLLADVENISGKDISTFVQFDVTFTDKEGKELGTIPSIVLPLKSGEKSQLNSSTTGDFANAYNFTIKDHKN